MKALLVIQRILALCVMICGAFLALCEVDVTRSLSDQAAITLGGVALVILGGGWMVLTGLEEDWFVKGRYKHSTR